jgi:hypothetical protein
MVIFTRILDMPDRPLPATNGFPGAHLERLKGAFHV